jgi:hypothetical protein
MKKVSLIISAGYIDLQAEYEPLHRANEKPETDIETRMTRMTQMTQINANDTLNFHANKYNRYLYPQSLGQSKRNLTALETYATWII